MSEKSIESRRAFFKKAGKVVVGAAIAAPFLAAAAKDAMASGPSEDSPAGCSCGSSCYTGCSITCKGSCTGSGCMANCGMGGKS